MADEKKGTLGLPKQETHEDAHIKRQVAASHADTDYRNVIGRELSDEEFQQRIAGGGLMIDAVMVAPPEIDGYDTMWGTTMSDAQSLMRWYLSNGYTYVTLEEVPNWRNPTPRTATMDGVVAFNELVAIKIKKGRREMLAKRFHHEMPLATEASIRSQLSSLSDTAKNKTKIDMEEGMRNMGKAPSKTPSFNL